MALGVMGVISGFVAKGFVGSASGASILGVGGYYLHKKYIVKHPLMRYLKKVTDKKFTLSSLVSYREDGKGMYYFKLKVPSGYSVDDMLKLKPAIEDKFDCEIQVWAEDTNFIIEMSTNPIPKHLNFDPYEVKEILQDYECAMYLGKSRLGDMIIDFTENSTPHLIFAGPTGGGKSNLINQGMCGMLQRYTPSELHLYLVDLKDGVELNPYKDVEHVKGFYENTSDAYGGLHDILTELKRRNVLFKKKGVKKLAEYNQVAEEKLPRILIVADEFAQFSNIADKDFKAEVYTKWEEILQKGRSTGIHVMIGTQIADANVFPRQIKGNIDARFAFKFTDEQHSKMITGGSELKYLPNIQGRGLFKLGTRMIQTQTPYIQLDQQLAIIDKYSVTEPEIEELPEVKEEAAPAQNIDHVVPIEEIKFIPIKKETKTSTTAIKVLSSQSSIDNLFMTEDAFINTLKEEN